MCIVSMCLSRHEASSDMQCDQLRSSCDLDLRSNIGLTFQGNHAYVSMRLDDGAGIVTSFFNSKVNYDKIRLF